MFSDRRQYGKSLIIWLFLILVPVISFSWHFNQIFQQVQTANHLLQETSLQSEMKLFQQSLSEKAAVERIMHKIERQLNLTIENPRLDFSSDSDPGFYTNNTCEQIEILIKRQFGISPAYIMSFGHKLKHLNQKFLVQPPDHSEFAEEYLKNLLAYAIIDSFCFMLAGKTPPYAQELKNFYRHKRSSIPEFGQNQIKNTLRFFFSALANIPASPGICYESSASKISKDRAFFYFNGISNRGRVSGGFFVVFSDASFNADFLCRQALKACSSGFNRQFVAYDEKLSGNFLVKNGEHCYFAPVPAHFAISFPQKLFKGEDRQLKYMLSVSMPSGSTKDPFYLSNKYLGFALRIFLLLLFAAVTFSTLFKAKLEVSLRSKFLGLTTLIALIPFLAMSYFSGLVLHDFKSLNSKKIETEAATRMYEINRYVEDLRIKRQLSVLTAKNKLAGIYAKGDKDFSAPDINSQMPKTFSEDINLMTNDGAARVFNASDRKQYLSKITTLLATNYLNKLGVLNTSIPSVQREVELVNMAGGFLDDLRRDNLEGRVMAKESQETKDLTELNDLHRMIYFLIPASATDPTRIAGIVFCQFFSIYRFGQAFQQIGDNPDLLLNFENEFATHRFAMGVRPFEGPAEKIFPFNLGEKDSLRLMIDQAILNKSSGQVSNSNGGETSVSIWRFFPNQEIVFAGISTSRPELWLDFIANIFPILLTVFILISLSLTSDLIYEMLVKPMKTFLKFISRINSQHFSTRVEIANVDEFSLLANSFNKMAEGLQQREKLRRFVSDKLFESIENDLDCHSSMPKESQMSILASDIRSFTHLSEKHDAKEIVKLLNEYFTLMGEAISRNGGIIERLVGDAVVAVFYPALSGRHHSVAAVQAALDMREALTGLNRQRIKQGKFTIENGIGIVTQVATTIITGSEKGRKVFAVTGNAVENAENLEAMTAKKESEKILICSATAAHCRGHFDIGPMKGFPEIFSVRDSE